MALFFAVMLSPKIIDVTLRYSPKVFKTFDFETQRKY